MTYLLRKDGLPGKYINIIVILSLLIILSFPISMERLGGLASLLIYVLLVVVMFWYILKGRVGDLAVLTSKLSTGEQFINNLIKKDMSANPVINEPPDDDESCLIETIVEIPEKEEVLEEDIGLDITPEDKKEEVQITVADETKELTEPEEKIAEVQIMTNVETAPGPDLAPETMLEEKETEEHMPAPEEIASSEDTTLQKDVDIQIEPLIQEMVEPILVEGDEAKIEEVELIEEVEQVEKVEQVEGVTQIEEVDEIIEAHQGDESKESETLEKIGLVDISAKDNEEAKTESQVQIIELIDNGFTYRDINKEEAVRCFEEAWHITSNYELKHLLTIELVEIYKECGWYSRAGALLDSFIALPGHKSDIINEINCKIDYIRLLAAELERLGISDLPISRVPRWVRLKVDAEMNPPGV
ncbi:MAG TPA: hypothetical protein DD791_01945 [Syntrophomonas sp.]|nr:hypothetical protein [Syntrophomonas sp.]